MTSWLLLRRLRGPAFLLLVGITALLNQWDILSFGRSWPLYLILWGLLSLAERAALAQANLEAYDPITGQPRAPIPTAPDGTAYNPNAYNSTIYAGPGSSIVPSAPSLPGQDSGAGRP
jgi:hypothetical protein